MTLGDAIKFVPARRPETIQMDASSYKLIKPTFHSQSPDRDSSSESSYDAYEKSSNSSDEDNSDESDSMEDSERSDTDASSTEESPDDSPSASEESDQLKVTINSGKNDEMSSAFYDINENANDRGSRSPKRIHKSWHPTVRAPVGLLNRGVTCYMNSAIQAILHLPAMGRYLLEVLHGSHPKVNKGSVTHELASLFKKMMEKKSPVFPMKLLRRLDEINPMLDEWQQEDSHEYYMSLLSRLQEDSVPKGEKLRSSIIHDIFGGSVEQKVTCQRCSTVSTTKQDFYDLPVGFSTHESDGTYTLEQSMKDFFTPETIHASEKGTGYQCEKCKRRTKAVKQIAICEAPEYLTIHIKRFRMDGNVSKKVKDTMKYSLQMDLTQYLTSDQKNASLQYKLIAVIVHEGRTVSSGHYIALTRQPNGKWMMYDDEMTRPVSESYVRSHPSAYILVYSRLLAKPNTSPESRVPKPNHTTSTSANHRIKNTKSTTQKSAPVSSKHKDSRSKPNGSSPTIVNTAAANDQKSRRNKTIRAKQTNSKHELASSPHSNTGVSNNQKRDSVDTIDEIFAKKKKQKTRFN